MKIAIDIDEVLADMLSKFIEFYNNKHSTSFKYEDFFSAYWWEVIGIEKEILFENFNEFINLGHVRTTKPFSESQEIIKKLSQKHSLYIITSRPLKLKEITHEWIEEHYKDCFEELHFATNTSGLNESKTKGEIAKELGAKILIEDQDGYARTCKGLCHVILVDRPWNRNYEEPHVTRVKSWQDIIEVIESLEIE